MAEPLTYEKILELFAETSTKFAETDAKITETTISVNKLAETVKNMSKEIGGISNTEASTKFSETDAKIAETTINVNKLAETVKNMSKEIGGISNTVGLFSEAHFINAMEETKFFAGVQFDEFERNIKGHIAKVNDEFDMVLYNGAAVALIEIKSKAKLGDLEDLATKKVNNFRLFFPYYKDYKIYLGIGSMSFDQKVLDRAHELGIGVLEQKGNIIEDESVNVRAY